MKNRKIIIFFTALLATALFVLLGVVNYKNTAIALSIYIDSSGHSETIKIWEDENNNLYAFLPRYAENSQVYLKKNTIADLYIDGIYITDDMPCTQLLNGSYTLSSKKYKKTITFLTSANIPAMYIDTQSGDMRYIHAEKGNKESADLRIYEKNGDLLHNLKIESINGRGNNTWEAFDKKPYSITLTEETDLLGMGKAGRWILLANADDPSNIRNKTVYDFADSVGMTFSPDSVWVDLYLNGEYAGLYQLCERNEVHPERVNISETDSYLISVEREERLIKQNHPYIITNNKQALRIHHPDNISESDRHELLNIWQTTENILLSADNNIFWNNLTSVTDINSWVNKYLIEEVFGNGDACYISQFFYIDTSKENKIIAGPVWDYDHTQGSKSAWEFFSSNILLANRLNVKDGYDTPWFHNLYKNKNFYNQLTKTYEEVFLPQLEKLYTETIYDYYSQIESSVNMNRIRWHNGQDIKEEVDYIRQYMTDRIDFLSNIWINDAEYFTVKADAGNGGFYGYYAVYPGETIPELPVLEDNYYKNFEGWYYADSDKPVDYSQPVYEDMEVYAKWSDTSGLWISRIEKLVPVGAIAVVFLCLGYVCIKRLFDYEL